MTFACPLLRQVPEDIDAMEVKYYYRGNVSNAVNFFLLIATSKNLYSCVFTCLGRIIYNIYISFLV